MTPGAPAHDDEWAWRVHQFAGRTEGVVHAAIVSRDGRHVACTTSLDADTADQLDLITAGITTYAHAAVRCYGGGSVEQAIIELASGGLLCVCRSETAPTSPSSPMRPTVSVSPSTSTALSSSSASRQPSVP